MRAVQGRDWSLHRPFFVRFNAEAFAQHSVNAVSEKV